MLVLLLRATCWVNIFDAFRSLLENAGAVMGERSLQWSMGRLYPGLMLHVGPSISGGLLEFVIDPTTQYDERSHGFVQEESTGRCLLDYLVYCPIAWSWEEIDKKNKHLLLHVKLFNYSSCTLSFPPPANCFLT